MRSLFCNRPPHCHLHFCTEWKQSNQRNFQFLLIALFDNTIHAAEAKGYMILPALVLCLGPLCVILGYAICQGWNEEKKWKELWKPTENFCSAQQRKENEQKKLSNISIL